MNWRTPALAFVSAIAALAVAPDLHSQPGFRAGVELLRVQATVVDGRGQPVRDLQAGDFTVRVDGRDRTVQFAHFFGAAGDGAANAAVPAPGEPQPSFALNTTATGGRAVIFVVDLISIRPGAEKLVFDTAAALADSLAPNDAAGLMPIPGPGIDLTRDHALVSNALRMLRGAATNRPFISHYFTINEAVAFEQGNRRVVNETIERECCQTCVTCPAELRDETRELLRFARDHVRSVLTSITGLANAMRPVEAPKTIVLISAGLPFEQESLSLFTDVQQSLTQAGIMIYAVQVSQPDGDAANMRRPGVGMYQATDITTGLANVATMAGGAMFMGVGTAAGVFERLRSEVGHAYELGIESTANDANGKPHTVEVRVSRPGLTVRSRSKVIAAERPVTDTQRLGNLLAQPVDVADLPVGVAAYSVRGEEPATLKVIIAAEMGRGAAITPPMRYALMIMQGAKTVFQVNDAATEGPGGARVITAAQLAPGRYRVRLASIDGSGRGGTVELPIGVGLGAAAGLQFSDAIVGVNDPSFAPVSQVHAGQALSALVELYSADPARFATAAVDYELRRTSNSAVIARSRGALRATTSERRLVAEGAMATSGLPPGTYSVVAIVSVEGKVVGQVRREVLVVEP